MSVHTHRSEGVSGHEGREGTNRVGGRIGVAGGIRDRNEVGRGDGDGNGDGDGDRAGTATTGVEANEGTQDGNGDGRGDRAQTEARTRVEICGRTQGGNGDRSGDGNESSSVDGNRDEDGNGDESEDGSGRAEERRRSARNCTRVVDAMHFYSARVIISTDRGWRLRVLDSSIREARYLYTRIVARG